MRLVFDSGRPIAHVAADLGIHPETLRKRVRQAEADSGRRGELLTTKERERLRLLERENRELRKANEILKACGVRKVGSACKSSVFAHAIEFTHPTRSVPVSVPGQRPAAGVVSARGDDSVRDLRVDARHA